MLESRKFKSLKSSFELLTLRAAPSRGWSELRPGPARPETRKMPAADLSAARRGEPCGRSVRNGDRAIPKGALRTRQLERNRRGLVGVRRGHRKRGLIGTLGEQPRVTHGRPRP